MRVVHSWRRALIAVAVVALGASGCGGRLEHPAAEVGSGPTRATELTLAINQDEGTLTPYTHVTGYPGKNLSSLVFETLLRLDADMDRLSKDILQATTLHARIAASKQLQAKIAERTPFVTLFYPNGAYPYRKETFDGWVYQKGANLLNAASFVEFTSS